MSSALVRIGAVVLVSLLLIVVLSYVAAVVHEGSHWIVGRLWTTDVTITRWKTVLPVSVNYHAPFQLPAYAIRLSGIAPLLIGFPLGLAVFLLLAEPFPVRVLVALPFWAATFLSPSDLLAICYPTRFQEYASTNDASGHLEMLCLLIDEARA